MSTKHISKGLDYSQIIQCANFSDAKSNFSSQEGPKPYNISRVGL